MEGAWGRSWSAGYQKGDAYGGLSRQAAGCSSGRRDLETQLAPPASTPLLVGKLRPQSWVSRAGPTGQAKPSLPPCCRCASWRPQRCCCRYPGGPWCRWPGQGKGEGRGGRGVRIVRLLHQSEYPASLARAGGATLAGVAHDARPGASKSGTPCTQARTTKRTAGMQGCPARPPAHPPNLPTPPTHLAQQAGGEALVEAAHALSLHHLLGNGQLQKGEG